MIGREHVAGVIAGVATGQGHHAQDPGIIEENAVEIVGARQRQFEHHLVTLGHPIQAGKQSIAQERLTRSLVVALDVDLGLDDRHETVAEDLQGDVELLIDDGLDARGVG